MPCIRSIARCSRTTLREDVHGLAGAPRVWAQKPFKFTEDTPLPQGDRDTLTTGSICGSTITKCLRDGPPPPSFHRHERYCAQPTKVLTDLTQEVGADVDWEAFEPYTKQRKVEGNVDPAKLEKAQMLYDEMQAPAGRSAREIHAADTLAVSISTTSMPVKGDPSTAPEDIPLRLFPRRRPKVHVRRPDRVRTSVTVRSGCDARSSERTESRPPRWFCGLGGRQPRPASPSTEEAREGGAQQDADAKTRKTLPVP